MATISGGGYKLGDLVDLLVSIRTKWLALLTKLDNDGGVADTNYLTLGTFSMPDGIQTEDPKSIRHQGLLVDFFETFLGKFNATLTKLDADGTVNNTNYNALWAITDVVGNEAIDSLNQNGVRKSAVVKMLKTIIANIAGVNAKLDADSGVTDTNYAALCNVTDNVDAEGTVARP